MHFLPISLVASSNAFAAASNSGGKDKVGPTLLGTDGIANIENIAHWFCSIGMIESAVSPEAAGSADAAGAAPPPTFASTFFSLALKSCSRLAIELRVA